MVIAIPAAAVIAGAVMLVLANATWDGLVADDYYQRGMQINQSLARDSEAARLGLGAILAFPAPGVVEARLTGAAAVLGGDRLNLRFARAARGGGRPDPHDPRRRRNLARGPAGGATGQVVRGARQRAVALDRTGADARLRRRACAPRPGIRDVPARPDVGGGVIPACSGSPRVLELLAHHAA